jgi:hypothetical protein
MMDGSWFKIPNTEKVSADFRKSTMVFNLELDGWKTDIRRVMMTDVRCAVNLLVLSVAGSGRDPVVAMDCMSCSIVERDARKSPRPEAEDRAYAVHGSPLAAGSAITGN